MNEKKLSFISLIILLAKFDIEYAKSIWNLIDLMNDQGEGFMDDNDLH